MKSERPPQSINIINNIDNKNESFLIIENKLRDLFNRTKEVMTSWDNDIYDEYKQIIENIDFNAKIPESLWNLNEKILDEFLGWLAFDVEFAGWNIGEDMITIIKNSIDLKNSQKFSGSLEILNKVEYIYSDFINDEFKPNNNKRPIQGLIEYLNEKTNDPTANLLLSNYVRHISQKPESTPYSQYPADYVIEIGGNRFADISSAGTRMSVSNEKDFDIINNLMKEREELDQNSELIKKIEEKSSEEERYIRSDIWDKIQALSVKGRWVHPEYKKTDTFKEEEKERIQERKKATKEYSITEDKIDSGGNLLLEDLRKKYGTKKDTIDSIKTKILNTRYSVSKKISNLMKKEAGEKDFIKTELSINKDNFDNKIFNLIWVNRNLRESIEHKIGIKFNEFNLSEQFQIINYLKTLKNGESEKIRNFSTTFKNSGFRTFLSIEQGGKEMGDKILTLGEKLPEDVAKKVFSKYGEIIDTADKAEDEVKKLYENDNIPSNVFISIKETLLKKGSSLLSGLANELSNNKKIEEVEILKTLDDIKTSTIIMGKSYLELYKQGIKVSIEDIKNTLVEKISASDLTDDEKKELLSVYEKGRPKETYENKEHIKLLRNEFEQILNNKETFIFNIRFGGDIVAFATFNKENNDTLHIGGLTFIDDIRNPAIGEAVMNSIMNEFGNYNIKALVHSENKVLKMYQNRFGFKIMKELPREENAGELYFEIERPKDKKIEQYQELKEVA